MRSLYDEDGIDGPADRAWRRAMREDERARRKKTSGNVAVRGVGSPHVDGTNTTPARGPEEAGTTSQDKSEGSNG